jgi:hypothetical protein
VAPSCYSDRSGAHMDVVAVGTTSRDEAHQLGSTWVRPITLDAMRLASFGLLLLVFTIPTFPGEWLEEKLPSVPIIGPSLASLHDSTIVGDVDLATNRPTSWWPNSNRLVLPFLKASFDNDEKTWRFPKPLPFAGAISKARC